MFNSAYENLPGLRSKDQEIITNHANTVWTIVLLNNYLFFLLKKGLFKKQWTKEAIFKTKFI